MILTNEVSGIPLLAKPFKVADLKRRIAEALQAPLSGASVGNPQSCVLAASI
jgi:hypothetical protein